MGRILFFGAGHQAEQMMLELDARKEFFEDEIVAFVDNDSMKWGSYIHGHRIVSPEEMLDIEFDSLVIVSEKYYEEIRNYLIEDKHISSEIIFPAIIYMRDVTIRFLYKRSLQRMELLPFVRNDSEPLDTSNTVVYTAIENGYDDLKEPEYTGDDITYVCFTDNKNLKSKNWNIIQVAPPEDGNYARDIRKYKFFPQDYFSEFSTSIWVDANFVIKKNLNDLIKKYSRGSSILCFPNSKRICLYEECGDVIAIHKAAPTIVIKQAASYIAVGYPDNNGLYSGGFIARNHHDPVMNRCMEDWWEQVNMFSERDQISLPYVLYRNHYEPDLTDLYIDDNEFFYLTRHNVGHWRSAH